MRNYYDCLVIGAGVAGSSAGYRLAKAGYHVAILEKTQGPHHKVCGEFLSFEAISYLDEMGISLDESQPLIKNFQLSSPQFTATFTFPYPGRGISRYKLDEELICNAQLAGACVFRGQLMKSYQKRDDLFRVETNTEHFYARHLFLATGKHDYSRNSKRQGQDDAYLGLKTHLHLKAHDLNETTVLFSFPGGYGGVCPIENDRMNFCFIIQKKIYKSFNGDLNRVLIFLRQANPRLDSLFEVADVLEPMSAIGSIPYGFLRPYSYKDQVYFLGDQRMVIPSLTGDGMAIALSTAKYAVEEFQGRQNRRGHLRDVMNNSLKKQLRWAMMAHFFLKFSWLTELCMRVPQLGTFLIKTFFQKTRISLEVDRQHEPKFHEHHYSRY
jgi:flavin-dependent dehydrogenase